MLSDRYSSFTISSLSSYLGLDKDCSLFVLWTPGSYFYMYLYWEQSRSKLNMATTMWSIKQLVRELEDLEEEDMGQQGNTRRRSFWRSSFSLIVPAERDCTHARFPGAHCHLSFAGIYTQPTEPTFPIKLCLNQRNFENCGIPSCQLQGILSLHHYICRGTTQ